MLFSSMLGMVMSALHRDRKGIRTMQLTRFARGFVLFAAVAVCFACASSPAFAKDMIPGQSGSASYLASSSSAELPVYSVSDSSIVKINASTGALTAKKAGKATVTMTQGDRKKTLSIRVYAVNNVKANRPKTVSALKIAQKDASTATLTWKKSSNASGYIVYSKTSGSYKAVDSVNNVATTSCELNGLKAQSMVDCVVVAYKKVTIANKVKIKTKDKKTGKTKTSYKTVKSTELVLASKSPYATMLVTDDSSTAANAASIQFARKQITILRKGSGDSCASVVPQVEGKELADSRLRYSVSDDSVASVDAKTGVVTSKSKKAASCTLTVTAHNGVSAKIKVNVLAALKLSDRSVFAHRGDSSSAPENTIAAYYKAAQNGFKAIEFDVWETYSGDLVICHNKSMEAIYGVDMDIREVNCDPSSPNYVGNFPVKSGNALDSYGILTVPTFEETMRIASAFKLSVSLHLKNPDDDLLSEEGLATIMSTLERYNLTSSAEIDVQSAGMVDLLTAKQSAVPVTFVLTSTNGFDLEGNHYEAGVREAGAYAASKGCKRMSIHYLTKTLYTAQLIDYLHSLGLEVGTWDIASAKKICYSLDVGIDELYIESIDY